MKETAKSKRVESEITMNYLREQGARGERMRIVRKMLSMNVFSTETIKDITGVDDEFICRARKGSLCF